MSNQKTVTREDLDTMELHEECELDNMTTIMAVPNGWIYAFWAGAEGSPLAIVSTVFVPYA